MTKKKSRKKLDLQGKPVRLITKQDEDFICITDIAKTGEGNHHDIVKNYFKNRSNIEFLGLWEELHNPNFNWGNFDLIKSKVSANNFSLSTKEWINKTNAKGIQATPGRYGGTYAHKDIAIHFATWLSPAAYLYLVKEFQRLKEEESRIYNLKWHISKITDNIEEVRNLLDTIPGQEPARNRLNFLRQDERIGRRKNNTVRD